MKSLRNAASVLLLLCSLASLPVSAAQSGTTAQETDRAAAREAGRSGAEPLGLEGIGNAGRVNEFLYRGAQPRASGYAELRKMGIEVVVDLRNRGKNQQRERRFVEAQGMRYVGMPVAGRAGPNEEQIASFLTLLRENARRKIFVHCKYGADRTGVMVAAYRMSAEGWTAGEAIAEMRSYHFHRLWLPAMRRTVREFPRRYESSPVYQPLREAEERERPAKRGGNSPEARPL